MGRELIAMKGYTIRVVSWENDGDNYKTEYLTVDSKEEALKIQRVCRELFCSCNNGQGGIGNSMDGEGDATIKEYIESNPDLELTADYIDYLKDELVGCTEFYDCRVCESATITYLEEDIYAKVI
jgi:hypothetical protein